MAHFPRCAILVYVCVVTLMLHVPATAVSGASAKELPGSSADQFRAFIQRHEEIEKQRKLEEAIASYAALVEYLDHGRVSRDFVRKDKQDYFARWPSEDTSIVGTRKSSQT